ncbi:hypothetical protein OIE69_43635 (plasmid) [Actinacidiphila glaucinigra]|uniref:hypothetical protein n=1 Tax=Actinacidiphila glaucinigra TaxID=235986 RepID=UPI002DDA7888|nr:hypothetical protein [Actinacidiphila glaucinigra]WSD65801.1 hypothetical protein OIE69_43635 [Actinacidiphila glaucinigra]
MTDESGTTHLVFEGDQSATAGSSSQALRPDAFVPPSVRADQQPTHRRFVDGVAESMGALLHEFEGRFAAGMR